MHEPLLFTAALPARTTCLGLPLRPYSIGHELHLWRDQNVLLFNEDTPNQFPALLSAVLICCHSWQELQRLTDDPLLRFKLWIWRRRIAWTGRKWAGKSARRNRGSSPVSFPPPPHPPTFIASELAIFRAYRQAGIAEFPLSDVTHPSSGPPPRSPGAPFLLRLQQWLMLTLHLTEAQAWDYPYALAKMRWAAYWEEQQGLEVYNQHDAEFDAFVAEQEAKGAAEIKRRKQCQE
jgi:hypothetical protein